MLSTLAAVRTLSQHAAVMAQSVRWYNPQALIDMVAVRSRERATALQDSEKRQKTFRPAVDHFRLSRFGWEHRIAGKNGVQRRFRSHKSSLLKRRIGYVHPRDYKMMQLYFPHTLLYRRVTPVDTNVNLRPERSLLPVHIG